ncbi:MAG: glycosyltransferase [Acidimicrobiia bacterium]|nr:glycosyltransferase [Acidimicrobiia bacterium]
MTGRHSALRAAPAPVATARLRVLYLIDSLGQGGAEHLLVRYLEALPEAGVDPTVVVIQDRDGNPLASAVTRLGVPLETLHIDRLRRRGALARVGAAIDRVGPDLVHTQLEFSNILGTIAAHRRGIPTVATLHTLDRPRPWSRDAVRFRLMARILASRSSRVIAVSQSAGAHFTERSGARRGVVTTLYNGIDLERFLAPHPAAAADLRHSLGIAAGSRIVTTVAVLRPPKGIADLIAALPAVVLAVPGTHLVIAGDGPARPDLEAAAMAHGMAGRVHFLGHRADVDEVLAAADLFVLPSHTEALPTVLIEAMATGLPVVATTVGGIPEMVERGSSALLVPPHEPELLAEAITRVLTSPLQAAAMATAGRRIARHRFDLGRQVGELVAEYRRVVAGGGSG